MVQKQMKACDAADTARRMIVPLAEGINTQVGAVRLRVSCTENNAAFVLDLKNVDKGHREGAEVVSMRMDWKDLAYMLTEKLDISFKNRYGMAEFSLERIRKDKWVLDWHPDEQTIN